MASTLILHHKFTAIGRLFMYLSCFNLTSRRMNYDFSFTNRPLWPVNWDLANLLRTFFSSWCRILWKLMVNIKRHFEPLWCPLKVIDHVSPRFSLSSHFTVLRPSILGGNNIFLPSPDPWKIAYNTCGLLPQLPLELLKEKVLSFTFVVISLAFIWLVTSFVV